MKTKAGTENQPDPGIATWLRPSIPAWLDDYDLKPSEFRLFCHVARREGGKAGKGCCNAAVPTIAKVCRLSENTVRKGLRQLVSLGLLLCKPRQHKTTLYRLVPKGKDWKSARYADNVPF
ncbi:MAG: helix-turn-helix domain-containing protein [Verrucomicrobiota bacterium]|jgi:hypothetical protein